MASFASASFGGKKKTKTENKTKQKKQKMRINPNYDRVLTDWSNMQSLTLSPGGWHASWELALTLDPLSSAREVLQPPLSQA